ncbi:MAG TPA: hypothetical protein VKZ77_08450 [Bacillaceae bacterium]|uniref:ATP synthase F0 subunit 8 n=1 Tax=Lederbergia graminis TaxID=735518 RepID=A0ABW0LLB0_9BACI|nr:hypothetical protein [Paenibacillus bovis]HLU22502.1 hypothetical protein [Bacillaceae bacterium]
MKIVLIIIASIFVLAASYFLYENSLGSIPFLLASFILFFLVRRMSKKSKLEERKDTQGK